MLNFQSDSSATKKSLSVVLTLALVISMIPVCCFPAVARADENESEQATSLSDFSQGVVYPGRQRSQEEIEELQRQGCVVGLFDASDINYKNSINTTGKANLASTKSLTAEDEGETLPKKVDMRDTNKVTPVRSQGYTSTCWSWASIAAAETSIANSTGQPAVEYSPFQTAYFGFTPLSSNTSELKGSEISQAGEGLSLTSSDRSNLLRIYGSSFQPASLMMQGTGPVTEESIPFPTQSLQDGNFYEENSLTADQRRQNIARLSKYNDFGSLITTQVESGQITYVGTDEAVLLNIKKTLASGNAVVIGYYADANIDYVYFSEATSAQYTYKYEPMNHFVSVVGYDDNYSKDNFIEGHQPEKDGAFIVKNSWGDSWGDGGYFYLSYYDQSIVSATSFEFDTSENDEEQIEGEEIVDQYDYLQWGEYIYMRYDIADFPDNQAWYSNIYTTSQKQQLHHIGTYVVGGMNTLGYKVYKLRSDATSPMDVEGSIDSPFAAGEVNIENDGYISVELEKPLNLNQGEKYAVWFYQTAGDHIFYIPQRICYKNTSNYIASTVVNEQESFCSFKPTVSWDAMTSADFSAPDEYAEIDAVQDNYCVKAYSTSAQEYCLVGFNSNGGTSIDSQFVKSGEKIASPAVPTKQGVTFEGWYKDSALTQRFDFDTEVISADVVLFAKWSSADETTTTDETADEATKQVTLDTPETPASTASNQAKQVSLSQTGDNLFVVVATVIAIASVAFICMRFSSRRRFQPKHVKR